MVAETPNAVIGPREIAKNIKKGAVKKIVVANNCPEYLLDKIKKFKVKIVTFDGDQQQLGTRLGKPFPVTMAGYPE
ncbi:MAG: ribosomal L7Ae/L30e/S12e/Gadd45 family protein [Candidatus Aenigmarchaeota archaeon]|nr:ribosomal L7Ae/L30e/S12e/Gadd45 family protein [Candidatus Aenigmarchaeota archaeon]